MTSRAEPLSDPNLGHEHNRRTVEAYEGYAQQYAKVTAGDPGDAGAEAMAWFVNAMGGRGHVLDIGSGPGWDADLLEGRGLTVRRTDITEAFRAVQAERGHTVELLDVLSDPLGGPYDGVMMLYVLQHLGREATEPVFAKIAAALRPGGAYLVSYREGDEETWERSERSGAYWVVERPWATVSAQLRDAGLEPVWDLYHADSDGGWRIALARKAEA